MSQNKINIISFDVPYPTNYGGVIDIFFKIKTLHEAGYDIILHCFQYGRLTSPILNKYCRQVIYYKRKKGIQYIFSHLPYITVTRNNKQLIENLSNNNYPILFEGLHTCFFINHPDLQNRQKIIRMHNVEHHYYSELAKSTTNLLKKLYYRTESRKLKKYEGIISNASCVATISKNDYNYFLPKHKNTTHLPAFHSFQGVVSKPGKGDYFLYHGNLAVEENEKAALFLIEKVFLNINSKLIIAGQSPTKRIQQKIQQSKNIRLIANPTEEKMTALIIDAHGCVLPTFQSTGLKLKLLISLFLGKYVIANPEMVNNTGLESLCKIAGTAKEFIQKIDQIKDLEFSQESINYRKEVLRDFSNKTNGDKLISVFNTL